MYEKYICPRIKTVEFYVRIGTKHTELSTTFTVTEFAKTHLQQSRLQKKFFACGGLLSAFVIWLPPNEIPRSATGDTVVLWIVMQVYCIIWEYKFNAFDVTAAVKDREAVLLLLCWSVYPLIHSSRIISWPTSVAHLINTVSGVKELPIAHSTEAWPVYHAKRTPMLALARRSWNKYVIP